MSNNFEQRSANKSGPIAPEDIQVLLVDDDDIIAALLEIILNSIGITRIQIAQDGAQAIHMLQESPQAYDLVLCDWNMPNKNGLEVHDTMRTLPGYERSCFILVSGVTEREKILAALAAGVDDYVEKPLERENVLAKIAQHFPKSKPLA